MPTHRISFNFDEQTPGAVTTSAPAGVVSAPAAAPAGQGQGVGARFDYRAEFASATAASVGPSSAVSGSSTSAASGKGVTGSTPVLESASALTPPMGPSRPSVSFGSPVVETTGRPAPVPERAENQRTEDATADYRPGAKRKASPLQMQANLSRVQGLYGVPPAPSGADEPVSAREPAQPVVAAPEVATVEPQTAMVGQTFPTAADLASMPTGAVVIAGKVYHTAMQQKDNARTKAAAKLAAMIPIAMTAIGAPTALPRSAEQCLADVVAALSDGHGRSKMDSARIFLEKYDKWLAEVYPGDAIPTFPLEVAALYQFRTWLRSQSGGATAASQLVDIVEFLGSLGLPCPSLDDMAPLSERTVQKKAAAPADSRAREPYGPKMCIDIERMARFGRNAADQAAYEASLSVADRTAGKHLMPARTAKGDLSPSVVYATADLISTIGVDRGDGIWAATFSAGEEAERVDGFFRYVTCIDKTSRVDVEQYVPNMGFEVDSIGHMDELVSQREGMAILPAFQFSRGDSDKPFASSKWVGGVRLSAAPFSSESQAKSSMVALRAHATGMTLDELRVRKQSGTHPARHVGAGIGAQLSWPEPEIDALGDWTTPQADPNPPRRAPRKAKAKRSNSATYHPRADKAAVVVSRARMMSAARFFIARAGGYDKLSYDTKWEQIIPKAAECDEAKPFYGAAWGVFELKRAAHYSRA